MRHRIAAPLGLVLLVSTLLVGCTRGDADLRAWIKQEEAKKGVPLEPPPEIKKFEVFTYADEKLRDPFSASPAEQELAQSGGPQPDRDRPREPLEAFPLDSLDMVGTIGLGADVEGLIKDPDGVIYRVRTGNYMGQNFGRITMIDENHIELVELVQTDPSSNWMERPATIALDDAK